MHVGDDLALIQQMKQQGRRDVVGQVTDQPQIRAEVREVEGQCVGFMDAYVIGICKLKFERRREIAVQLDRM